MASTGQPASIFPDACAAARLTANRCGGFAAWAVGQAGIAPGHVEQIELNRVDCPGDPTCPSDVTGYAIVVRLTEDNGTGIDVVANCTRKIGSLGGGINYLCDQIETGDGRPIQYPLVSSAISGGYRDVPCSGEGPVGCATPLPTIEPAALAQSVPLMIGSLEIAVDHAGPYSVLLGQASLPNGVLSATALEVSSSPTDPLVAYEGYRVRVTSLDGGPPFSNYYEHGWRSGTERVEVTLDFVVLMFEPDAVVVVSDVDVH